ncbi:TPA: glycosyltransferase [Vibrio vulnificus]
MNNCLLTIAICTYNRQAFLEKALASVISQIENIKNRKLEVLVVDNNSVDSTKVVVDKHLNNSCADIRYVVERNQGLSHARNCAVTHAKGKFIAFLDDDGYLCEGWLDSVIYECETNTYDIFGGVYLPSYDDGKETWFIDKYASNIHIDGERRVLSEREYLSGGNICFNVSKVFNDLIFPTMIGMTGEKVAYGEEIFIQKLARKKGLIIGYSPSMKIMHYTGLNKQKLSWQLERLYAAGRDVWHTQGIKPTAYNIGKMMAKMFINPLIRLFRKSSYINHKVFIVEVYGPVIFCFSAIRNSRS